MLEGYVDEEEQQEQQPVSGEVVTTNNGHRNQRNCPAVCVLLAAKERAQCATCDVVLCVVSCFVEYHINVNL